MSCPWSQGLSHAIGNGGDVGEDVGEDMGQPVSSDTDMGMGMQTGGSWHLYLVSLGQQQIPSGQFSQKGIPFSGFNLLK